MNTHRTLTLIAAAALSPWLAFSTLNGHTAAGNTIRTSYPLEGKDSIVTTIDGKIVSIEIVEKGSPAGTAGTKKKKTPTDTTALVSDDNAAATAAVLQHHYRMQLLENEHEMDKLRLKAEEETAKSNYSRRRVFDVYKQTIAILLICIGLPLLLVFAFLSYRLRVRNKRNNDFEKFLTDLVKNGQSLSPELVTALRAQQLSTATKRASGTPSGTSDAEAETSLSNLDEEGFRALEKKTFLYCSRRACLAAATLLLIFWAWISGIDALAVLLFIPFLFFLFQGGIRFFNFYIEKRYRNTNIREGETPREPENAFPDNGTPSRPASSTPTETANSDGSLNPTL